MLVICLLYVSISNTISTPQAACSSDHSLLKFHLNDYYYSRYPGHANISLGSRTEYI